MSFNTPCFVNICLTKFHLCHFFPFHFNNKYAYPHFHIHNENRFYVKMMMWWIQAFQGWIHFQRALFLKIIFCLDLQHRGKRFCGKLLLWEKFCLWKYHYVLFIQELMSWLKDFKYNSVWNFVFKFVTYLRRPK